VQAVPTHLPVCLKNAVNGICKSSGFILSTVDKWGRDKKFMEFVTVFIYCFVSVLLISSQIDKSVRGDIPKQFSPLEDNYNYRQRAGHHS
jgi:hypothetical protein